MKRTLIACAVSLLVAGCATQPPPQVIEKPVRVDVPVSVPCKITPVTRPVFAFGAALPSWGLYDKGRALLADREQRQAYEGQLEAAVRACQ